MDSCASASLTDQLDLLSNVRVCSEPFRDASKRTTYATHIGDLPAVARDSEGKPVRVVFKLSLIHI